jgi:hypothetical protein
MAVAPFLRLLVMTLVIVVGGPLSALGCGVVERAHRPVGEGKTVRQLAGAATSTSGTPGTLRRATKARGVLLALLSQALAQPTGQAEDEFDAGDTPDLVDDESPQSYANIPFPGASLPTLAAPDLAQNLWGIQPSIGHPHGDDEPPRV